MAALRAFQVYNGRRCPATCDLLPQFSSPPSPPTRIFREPTVGNPLTSSWFSLERIQPDLPPRKLERRFWKPPPEEHQAGAEWKDRFYSRQRCCSHPLMLTRHQIRIESTRRLDVCVSRGVSRGLASCQRRWVLGRHVPPGLQSQPIAGGAGGPTRSFRVNFVSMKCHCGLQYPSVIEVVRKSSVSR